MVSPTPTPAAILALWNDITETRIAEYDRWHALEHVPERVWVPGFIAGTRYVATVSSQPRYFTLYEMESLASLESPEYQDLVDNPSPWSASMRPSFSNFLRKPCTIESGAGQSSGVGLGIMRLVWTHRPERHLLSSFSDRVLAQGSQHCVVHARLGEVAQAGPQAMVNVQDAPPGYEYVALVQTATENALPAIEALIADSARAMPVAPTWLQYSSYRFASRVMHEHVRQANRPAPRLDLMPA